MFVLYTSGGMVPSFQGHGTSARFSLPLAFNQADAPSAKDRQSMDKLSTCERPRGPHAVCVGGLIYRRGRVPHWCAPSHFSHFRITYRTPLRQALPTRQ